MAIQIQFRRGTATEWSTVNPTLAEGEMGIETDTNLFKIGTGLDLWNDLPYGGLRGFTGSVGFAGSIGNVAVQNVLYVSKSGNDANSGTALNLSKLTIKSALSVATNGTTIFVKSGDYTEINPLLVPEGVAIVGDNLRTVTVRPSNRTQDLFWVNNGVYLAHMTFKDHESPGSAVAFPTDGSAGVIHTSPYVQNCTSMTTTGTGMRIDGAHSEGLKSMVVDAYTQYNQGGIGIHHLNRGNSQLVSVFTICCDVAFLCESGGFCSITNSNSSFGNYALKSDGVSTPLYSGKVKGVQSGGTIIIDNLVNRPFIGDAVKFAGDPNYYTVSDATDLLVADVALQGPNFTQEPADAKNIRSTILDSKSKIQVDVIDYLNETFPSFDFDQFKCSRDVGLIIDAAVDDMMFGTNYKTRLAAISYFRASAAEVTGGQISETIAAINFAKTAVLDLISVDSTQGPEYVRISDNFDTIIALVSDSNGLSNAPAISYPSPTNAVANRVNAKDILRANRQFFIEEGIAYITANFPMLGYDRATCERDVGLIIDAIGYDLMFGSNFRSITAGRSYYREGAAVVTNSQKTATIAAFTFLKTQIANVTGDNATALQSSNDNMDIIIDILDQGLSAVPSFVIPSPTGYDSGYENARNLISANRSFIKAEVIQYITNNYPGLSYDPATCQRDIDLILDAVYYDLTYGGNLETLIAGNAYYSYNSLQIPAGEKAATLAAYNFMKDLIGDIAVNTDVVELQNSVLQVSGTAGSSAAAAAAESLIENIRTIINDQTQPATVTPDLAWVSASLVTEYNQLQSAKSSIKSAVTTYIESNYAYDPDICRRDIGYIIDAISYDILYGGNGQTADAADEYYSGGQLQIKEFERQATADTFSYIKSIADNCLLNTAVTPLNSTVSQDTGNPAASSAEVEILDDLFDIVINLIENGYTSTVTLEEVVTGSLSDNTAVTFHQFSLITSSGHTFEWVGAGTNVNTALPYQGGKPVLENQVVEVNQGKVYFTGTDQRGDFRIGNDFVINRNNGTITGRTFTKSLFAVMTPYILAIGE